MQASAQMLLKKLHSRAGTEWGECLGYHMKISKALKGLKGLSRQWVMCLGDALRDMGFYPSHADPDLWMKKSSDYDGYDHI